MKKVQSIKEEELKGKCRIICIDMQINIGFILKKKQPERVAAPDTDGLSLVSDSGFFTHHYQQSD